MWAIVLLAVVIRLLAVVYFRTYDITPERGHWNFGYEEGRVARSLATGKGFSSPMPEPTGPTGYVAPVFPFVLAGVFKMFGEYTAASAIAIYVFDALPSALTCVALYGLGARIFGQRVGLVSALLFALYPPSIWHASGTIWDTSLLAFALVALMDYIHGLPPAPSQARLAFVGSLMGFTILINPAPALFYPAIAVWVWYRLWSSSRQIWTSLPGPAILTISCLFICLPWMIRNAIVIGEFAPRTLSGMNLRLGNNENAWKAHGSWSLDIDPPNSMEEEKVLAEMGEAGYDRYCTRLAVDFIRQNPRKFVDLIGDRLKIWWSGSSGGDWAGNFRTSFRLSNLKLLVSLLLVPLAAIGCIFGWRRGKSIGLLVALFGIYPIPYYLFFVSERYRFPIEPFLLLLATFGLVESASGLPHFAKSAGKGVVSTNAAE